MDEEYGAALGGAFEMNLAAMNFGYSFHKWQTDAPARVGCNPLVLP